MSVDYGTRSFRSAKSGSGKMAKDPDVLSPRASGVAEWVQQQKVDDDSYAHDGSPSRMEMEIVREAAESVAQRKRLSVRDLASKFETGAQAAAAKLASERGKTSLRVRDSEFNKLQTILNDLRGRVPGRSKGDVDEALKAMTSLQEMSAKQEIQLTQERAEMKKLALLVKQCSDDARKMTAEAQALARTEIAAAEEIALKIQNAIQQQQALVKQQQPWTSMEQHELEELKRESLEARRIIMLHESSRTVEMEKEINTLRQQLNVKGAESANLRKELETFKQLTHGSGRRQWYQLTGLEQLGATLSIERVDDTVADLSRCSIQWYRARPDGTATDPIAGAIRPQYAPEPFDVGRVLRVEIVVPSGKPLDLQTAGTIENARGLDEYVEILAGKGGAQFNVRIVLKNGELVKKQSLHTFDVNKTRIKLWKAHTVKARENYSTSMQLCGARGGGDSSSQGLFWAATKGVTFMLVLESERERNAAILLARKFAKINKISLGGHDDTMEG